MKIQYNSKGKKLNKPLNLTLKQLLKRDAAMVLNNLPVISYKKLHRPNYLKPNIEKINPDLFKMTKILFGWDKEKTKKEFFNWYENGY